MPLEEAGQREEARHGFVVAAYGDSPFLDACLASLAAQTRPGPVIVSTSTPSAFVAEAARRHGAELVLNPERRGIGTDWNFALAQARWPMVTVAHQDDLYAPEFAECSAAALDSAPDAVLAFTGHEEIADDGVPRLNKVIAFKRAITRIATSGGLVGGVRQSFLLAFGNPIACSSVTFHRERCGDVHFSTDLASNLDWDAWWRLHLAGNAFAYVPRALVKRRYNALSATSSLLRDGTRGSEDALMFGRIWPKPAAALLATLYKAGYR